MSRKTESTSRPIRRQSKPVRLLLAGAAGAAAVLVLAGCANPLASNPELDFAPDDQPRSLQVTLNAQAANGARNDAMLYPHHFDGAALNSLGVQKLDLMLRAQDHREAPLVVYVNAPEKDRLTAARRQTVQGYLADRGLQASAYRVDLGVNPMVSSPAAGHLVRMPKTESGKNEVDALKMEYDVPPVYVPSESTGAAAMP